MKRRLFVAGSGALAAGAHVGAAANLLSNLGDAALKLSPTIFPRERLEKREYDNSRRDLIAWEKWSSPKDGDQELGFVEALAQSDKIPVLTGGLHRPEIQRTPKSGFYWYFGLTVSWLALPRRRRVRGAWESEERYARDGQYSDVVKMPFEANSLSIDFNDLKIIEGERTYIPSEILFVPGDGMLDRERTPVLKKVQSVSFPSKRMSVRSLPFSEVLFFDLRIKPVRFRLELPKIHFNGVDIPLPVCHFEPYDELRQEWV